VDPDGESRQFDRQGIQINAEDAPPCDLPSKQPNIFEGIRVELVAELLASGLPQTFELVGNSWKGALDQIVRETPFDVVQRCHKEVARAHGNVGDTELEKPVGSVPVFERVESPEVVLNCRI
jgi:hypothetical protein